MGGSREQDTLQRRTLVVVLALNVLLFVGLGVGGLFADSSALLANPLDNGSNAAVYMISILAIGRTMFWKTCAARLSGIMLLIFAAGVLLAVGRRWIVGTEPVGWTMMGLAVISAVVNLICLVLLKRQDGDDVNLEAAQTFSVNDFASNGGMLVAGGLVTALSQAWPNRAAGLAFKGGMDILRDASSVAVEGTIS
ncbi:cation transporter [Brevundimonas sp. CEF1]|jgi:cobalt-zinc-cadmium efflux system protein|uniref:cation transporter n=1 Tax=Brevundimonas sp. CEF1 TaxID=3442642 RepID=UPI003F515A7A